MTHNDHIRRVPKGVLELHYCIFQDSIPKRHDFRLIPSQWTPTSLSWLHSGSPRMDLGTQFKTLVSPDMQFSLSRKMGPDPTPKLSDARRNRTPTH